MELQKIEKLNINRKQVRRVIHELGITAIYPKRNLSKAKEEHKKYPYLLKGLKIERVNQVWATDITYIRVNGVYLYPAAIIDHYSRKVLSWRLSNTIDKRFYIETLNESLLKYETPELFNSGRSQFTNSEFLKLLEDKETMKISMDSKGRALDDIYIEKLWRSLKYENIYLNDYKDMKECREGIRRYFKFYNGRRRHQEIDCRTPNEV